MFPARFSNPPEHTDRSHRPVEFAAYLVKVWQATGRVQHWENGFKLLDISIPVRPRKSNQSVNFQGNKFDADLWADFLSFLIYYIQSLSLNYK